MELRSTGNPDVTNLVTMSMLEYLRKKGIESMSGICKYPERVCPHMTVLKCKAYCDVTPCQLVGELPKRTKADEIRNGSDMFISVQIAGCIVSYLIQNEILNGTEADHTDLISGIADDILEWLRLPAEVDE